MTTDPRPSPPPGPAAPAGPLLEQRFDAGSLYALRAAVAAHADAAGLSRQRVYDVTAAVHEMAANAVLHGVGHGLARLWTQDGFLHCQVSDSGPARRYDPGPPPRAVPWPAEHGHGLWIVAQVADSSSADHRPDGTTVTARFALRPARHLARRTQQPGEPPKAAQPRNTGIHACGGTSDRWPGTHAASAAVSRAPLPATRQACLRQAPGTKAGTAWHDSRFHLQLSLYYWESTYSSRVLFPVSVVPQQLPVGAGAGRPGSAYRSWSAHEPGSPRKACQVP